MDAEKDVATSEGFASSEDSGKQTTAPNDEPAERIPDPSADFLKRKARLREEVAVQPQQPFKDDQSGSYRGDTTSGAFRPLMYGHGK